MKFRVNSRAALLMFILSGLVFCPQGQADQLDQLIDSLVSAREAQLAEKKDLPRRQPTQAVSRDPESRAMMSEQKQAERQTDPSEGESDRWGTE